MLIAAERKNALSTAARGEEDEYRSLSGALPLLEWLLEAGMRRIRGDMVHILQARGARRILDVGCGTGALSRRLADAGLEPICLDVSPTMLASAARKAVHPPQFSTILGNARRLPYSPQFDAVTLSLVLHEMEPAVREAAWPEMHRVLQPGGIIVAADYIVPERTDWRAHATRAFFRWIEYQAGKNYPPHYASYEELMRGDGLLGWVRSHDDTVLEERRYFTGNLAILVVAKHHPAD